jgi:hypothetical protein
MVLTGCSAEPNVTSDAPSASSLQPSPAPTDAIPAPALIRRQLPSLVDRPCRFEGKDLNDYKSIVKSFDAYFNGLSDNVLRKRYKASAAYLAPQAAMKAHPNLSPKMSPPALRASLKRQRDRLAAVAIICIQRNAAG